MAPSAKHPTTRKSAPKSTATRRKAAAKTAPHLPAPIPASASEPAAEVIAPGVLPGGATALFGGIERAAEFGRLNIEALMASGEILACGCEDLGKLWLGIGQRSLDDGAALARAMAGVRTLQDLVALQSDLARMSLDRVMHDGARMSELATRVANEAMAPLQARFGSAFYLGWRRDIAA